LDIHKAFRIGAMRLAHAQREYTALHKSHGIDPYEWEILTQDEYWSVDQAQKMRTILANIVEVSMTIAGMPAIPLPGHYVAAVIAVIVSPVNQMLACTKAPDTFDAAMASGLEGTYEVKPMSVQQLCALVIAYSGDYHMEPQAHRIPKSVETKITESVEKSKK
jgi:hypothetical protein